MTLVVGYEVVWGREAEGLRCPRCGWLAPSIQAAADGHFCRTAEDRARSVLDSAHEFRRTRARLRARARIKR